MKNCKACGAYLGEDILECPHCGSTEIGEVEKETKKPEKDENTQPEVVEEAPAEAIEPVAEETEVAEEVEAEAETEEAEVEESAEEEAETEEAEAEESAEEEAETEEAEAEESAEEKAETGEAEEKSKLSEYKPNDNADSVAEEGAEPPKKKLSKKAIGIIAGSVAGAVAVIVGVICLFTFVDFDINLAYDSNEKTFVADENVTGEAAPAIAFVANTPYEMTENFSDYQIKINNNVYKVPMPVKEILDSGWAFGYGEDGEKNLNTGETNETFFVSKDGAVMYATVINFYSESAMQNECYVCRLKVDFADNDGISISIVNDLPLGVATKTGVEQIAGETSDAVVTNGRTVLRYKASDTKYAKLMFEKKTESLTSVEYYNSDKPYDFKEKEVETTAYVGYTDAVVVEKLGNDLMSGYVEFEGDIYQLPILVSDMQNKGWEVSFEEDRWLVYPDEHLYVTLTRGDKIIHRIDVYNNTAEDMGYPNCRVVSLSVSVDDDYSIVWPNKIKPGITEDEFLKLIGTAEYELNTTHFNEYSFTKDEYFLIVTVDKDEKIVTSINMYYDETLVD